ncbi:MAG: hypothetical protein PUC29_00335, partial [Clostridia bacterium]|nr:hypothetical protein [Clostridia bacterium]
EPRLYDYLCECVRELDMFVSDEEKIRRTVEKVTADYPSPDPGTRERLTLALLVMVTAYVSGRLKRESEGYFDKLCKL